MRANKPAAGMSRDRGEMSVRKVRDQENEALSRRTAGDDHDSAETPKPGPDERRGNQTNSTRFACNTRMSVCFLTRATCKNV